VRADAQEDRLEALGRQLVHVELRDLPIELDLGPQVADELDLVLEDLLGQTVVGDPHGGHPAPLGQGLEYRDLVAHSPEVVGRGEPRGPRAHDGHFLRPLGSGPLQGARSRSQVMVDRRPFQQADGQRLVDAVAHAGLLAGVRAGTADDAGQDAALADEVQRLAEPVVADELDVAGDVQPGRTGLEAGGRDGHLVGSRRALLPRGEREKIIPEVPDGIEHGGDGRCTAEIALRELHDPPGDALDLGDVLLPAPAGDKPLEQADQPVDAEAAHGTFPAGELPGLLEVPEGERRDVRRDVRNDHAVPSHEGREGLVAQHRRDAGIGCLCPLPGPVVYDLPIPAAEGYCTHSLSPYLSVFCFRPVTRSLTRAAGTRPCSEGSPTRG